MTIRPDHTLTCRRSPQEVAAALIAADVACRSRGLQFTAIRRAVLESLWETGQPVGAYDLIRLLDAKLGRAIAPPTVYRALDFLLEQGFVVRIATKNAFVPCAHPDHPHACVFLICEHCGASAEIENRKAEVLLEQDAAALGFRIGKRVIEMQGTCADCLSACASSL